MSKLLCRLRGHPVTEQVSEDWVRPMSFTYLHTYKCKCGKINYSKEVRHFKEMD
jgi:hypothetical protein